MKIIYFQVIMYVCDNADGGVRGLKRQNKTGKQRETLKTKKKHGCSCTSLCTFCPQYYVIKELAQKSVSKKKAKGKEVKAGERKKS